MTDEELHRALNELPRRSASQAFGDRVLLRLEEPLPLPEKATVGRPVAAAAAAALVAALGWALLQLPAPSSQSPDRVLSYRTDLQHLRQQHRELTREVEQLRALVGSTRPVLFLGGDEQLGLVLPEEKGERALPHSSQHYPLPQPVRVERTSFASF